MPGCNIVGETGDGLEFGSFEGGAGNLCLGGELRGIEEAAGALRSVERKRDHFADQWRCFHRLALRRVDPRDQ